MAFTVRFIVAAIAFFTSALLPIEYAEARARYLHATFSPDGRSLLIRRETSFHIFDAATGSERIHVKSGRYYNAAFSRDGSALHVADADGFTSNLVDIDAQSGREIFAYRTEPAFFASTFEMTASNSEGKFVTWDYHSRYAAVWAEGNPTPLQKFQIRRNVWDMKWGPDNETITTIRFEGEVLQHDVLTGKELRSKRIAVHAHGGEFTRNFRSILVTVQFEYGSDIRLVALDARSLKITRKADRSITAASVGLNDFATCGKGHQIEVRRFSFEIRKIIELPYDCDRLTMSPDSKQILALSPDGYRFDLVNAKTGSTEWTHVAPID